MPRIVLNIAMFLTVFGLVSCGDDDSDNDADSGPDTDADTDTDTGTDTDTDTDTDTGSDTDTGEPGEADYMISGVDVQVHAKVKTFLVVTWSQDVAADSVRLRYTFENDQWYESPAKPAGTGDHQELILGAPEQTEVTFHLVISKDGQQLATSAYTGTTGSIPTTMPKPTIVSYDASLASSNRWLFGAVDDTPGADEAYSGPFWLYIIDREGRIVWYFSNIGDNPILNFPRVSRDGRYVFCNNRTPWDENAWNFVPRVTKMTLDQSYFEEISLDLEDNVDMTDHGSLLFNTPTDWYGNEDSWLKEYLSDGTQRNIWNCTENFGSDHSACYSNTINWNPEDDTVMMSFPIINTVVQIDRQTGDEVARYGDASGSYSFSPASWQLEFQHWAHITKYGTLMVSSHMPNSNTKHAFIEFEIDRTNEVLTEKWMYNDGDEFAHAMGEAHYVDEESDNVLVNYGTAGVIRELTQDKQIAWEVKFDGTWSDDEYNKMVGHCSLIDDLYALNQGPE